MKKLNFLLAFSVIVLMVYLPINMMSPHRFSVRCRGIDDISKKLTRQSEAAAVFNEETFKRRSLFNALIEKRPVEQQAEFELLGLIAIGDKTAAMVRDVREKKDYYCLGGEQIGAFKVKRILKDKVILESAKQTLELYR